MPRSSVIYSDLLDADVDIVVIPVNSEGVAGAGLAKEFAQRYPLQTQKYLQDCVNPRSTIHTHGYSVHPLDEKRTVLFFVTKKTWRENSTKAQLKSVFKALLLYEPYLFEGTLVGTPPLGCGCGRMNKDEVIPYIKKAFITLGSFVNVYDLPKKERLHA